jgi:hypothetical protein
MRTDFKFGNAIAAIEICESNGLTGTARALRNIVDGIAQEYLVTNTAQVNNVTKTQEVD